jgi:hypothetical protein
VLGVGHGGRHGYVSCARRQKAARRSGGLSLTGLVHMAPGRCGELVLTTLRRQWSVRAAGGGDLPCSSLGDSVGGSLVYLRRWRKHQWERRTMAILPGRLARCGRQHKGVAAAKTVARVGT